MILVTGGTGMVGSHLIYDLLQKGEQVRAIKRPNSNTQILKSLFKHYHPHGDELYHQIEWIDGDVLDYASLMEAMEQARVVYHGSAMVSFHSSDKKRIHDTNVIGTSNVVNAALENRVDRLCFLSSIAALGNSPDGQPVDEQMPLESSMLDTRSFYSKSKFHSEMEIWRGATEGLDTIVVNPSIILGPGDWRKGSPYLFKSVWDGMRFYTLGGSGFVDVRDVTKAMISLTNSSISHERFILNAENLSFKELFDSIADAIGTNKPNLRVSPLLTELAWRLDTAWSTLQGKRPKITRETVRNAHQAKAYSNKKIIETLRFHFIPIKDTIQFVARVFLTDIRNHRL